MTQPRRSGRASMMAVAVALATASAMAADAASGAASSAAPDWQLVGRQGIIQVVVVPAAQAHDRDAYAAQALKFCAGIETCFINFYTNSTNAPLALPLPDAVNNEPTAIMRRSAKQGVDGFRWSCRMGSVEPNCF